MTENLTMPARVERIVREVGAAHGVRISDIIGKSMLGGIVAARFEAMWRVRKEITINGKPPSLATMGRWFGGRDQASVHNAVKRFEAMNGREIELKSRGFKRVFCRPMQAPAPHRLQMLADLADAAA